MSKRTIMLEAPARSGRLARGGRRVGWTEWGELDAPPIVLCTGAAMTSSLGLAADVPRARGVRVVCVDRAGLGRSEPDPAKSFASWSADVGAVLDHLGIASTAAIGFSQGAPFALALAAAHRVHRLALVAPQDELAHASLRPLLVPDVARMVDAVAADPAGFEAELAGRADADGMHQLVLAMSSPHDRAVYEQPGFAAAYRATLADAFAQGAAGYARDLVLALGPWPMQPETIDIPVDVWVGALDTSPVHVVDRGVGLAARFPRATRHELADAGGSLLWTHGDAIVAQLLSPG